MQFCQNMGFGPYLNQLGGIFLGLSRGSILKTVQNGPSALLFRFCKIGLRNTIFIFGRKNGRLFVCFVLFCCNIVRFWLTFLIEALIELKKMLIYEEKIILCTVWELLNPKVPRFCRFTGFTKMQLT